MRSSARQIIDGESHRRDRWLISYADLVTLLLALFIVLYAASDKERASVIAQTFAAQNTGGTGILPANNAETEDRVRFQQKLVEKPGLLQKAKIRESRDGLVISLSEAGFFAPGEAVINSDGIAAVKALAESVRDENRRIRIEGHTDSTPISNAKFPSNWELSTARAASVLSQMIDAGVAPERLSAAGYAGFQPIADNGTLEGRAQNRRVDVVILDR